MAPPDKQVLERVVEVGDSLLNYLSSVNQLLSHLDKLENLLSSLDQAPDTTVKDALIPSMEALLSNELFRHSDMDVKISVISCIAEITRITAPEAPFNDQQMKEIFKLTVAAFEKLSDGSGRCYEKAILIVDNVARVRSCLLMLDLECDDLIIEMFQHFMRVIRSNHPHFVKYAMETIMTMVLNESEEISVDLLRPLLDSVRKENQEISPISWSLGEKVITNCADKLQPYLLRAVQSTGKPLDAFAQIVVSICQRESETLQCNHLNGSRNSLVQADENKPAICKDGDEQPSDVTMGLEPDMTCARDVTQTMDDAKPDKRNASASTMDEKRNNAKPNLKNGNLEAVREPKSETELDTMPMKRGRKPNSLMNPEEGYDHSWICMGKKSTNFQSRKARTSGCDFPSSESPACGEDKLLSKPENVGEVSQPKTKKAVKAAQPRKARDNRTGVAPSKILASQKDKLPLEPKNAGELSQPKIKKTTKAAQSRKACDNGIELSSSANPALRKKFSSKPENMTQGCEGSEALESQPKTDKNTDAAHPSTNHSITEISPRKRGRPRKNSITNNQVVDPKSISMVKEDLSIAQLKDNSFEPPSLRFKKDFEVMKDAEPKIQEPLRKIELAAKTDEKTAMDTESIDNEMECKSSSEEEEKPKSVMNIETGNKDSRSLTQIDVKKRRRLDATPNKDANDSSINKLITKSATKTLNGVEETPQTRPRKKGTSVCVEASEMRDCNEPLVGSRIKVWWPIDKRFYEGTVDSYDSAKRKHKILYVDGDVEVLNLKKQRWELIADHVSPDAKQGINLQQLEAVVASDTAEKGKGNSESESSKGVNVDSHRKSRSRASARIPKSVSAKSAGKSEDEPAEADESMVDPPGTKNEKKSSGKSRTKRPKIVTDTKKVKSEAASVKKSKLQKAKKKRKASS